MTLPRAQAAVRSDYYVNGVFVVTDAINMNGTQDQRKKEVFFYKRKYSVRSMSMANHWNSKVDTGAKCNVLSSEALAQIQHKERLDTSKRTKLVTYGGDEIPSAGSVLLSCQLAKQPYNLRFQVIE